MLGFKPGGTVPGGVPECPNCAHVECQNPLVDIDHQTKCSSELMDELGLFGKSGCPLCLKILEKQNQYLENKNSELKDVLARARGGLENIAGDEVFPGRVARTALKEIDEALGGDLWMSLK